jgi:hypothetical protein
MTGVERWAEIPLCPGYELSDMGRVKSVHRVMIRRDGKPCTTVERILKLSYSRARGYCASVSVSVEGKKRTLNVDSLMRQIWGSR